MKSHINYNNINDITLKSIIDEAFKDFLTFIGVEHFPFPECVSINIFTDYNEKFGNKGGYFQKTDTSRKPYTLGLKRQACIAKHKPTMFHEFTHLMDFIKLCPQNKQEYINIISEIRAKYVEHKINAEYSSLYDNHKLSSNDIMLFPYIKDEQPLSNIIDIYNNLVKSYIINYSGNDIDKPYDILTVISYYIGFILFIEHNTDISVNYSNIIDITEPILGEGVKGLFDNRKYIPLDFAPLPEKVIKLYELIRDVCYKFYRNHYIFETFNE